MTLCRRTPKLSPAKRQWQVLKKISTVKGVSLGSEHVMYNTVKIQEEMSAFKLQSFKSRTRPNQSVHVDVH